MSMVVLVNALLDLANELPRLPRPLLIGGEFWPPARATEDVDLLLPTEILVSVDHMRSLGMTRLLVGAEDAGLSRADVRGEEFREALREMLWG